MTGSASQGPIRYGIHIAHDQIRTVPGLQERVRPTVNADEDRFVLPDVVVQRLQVFLVVVAANHDQRVATLDARANVGDANTIDEQVLLAHEIVHRVLREGL